MSTRKVNKFVDSNLLNGKIDFMNKTTRKTMKDVTQIERWIKMFCLKNRITVSKLADSLGITRAAIYKYMKEGDIGLEVLRDRISTLLDVEREQLDVACGRLPERFKHYMRHRPFMALELFRAAFNHYQEELSDEVYGD